jgi:hypothetical protein
LLVGQIRKEKASPVLDQVGEVRIALTGALELKRLSYLVT